MPAGPEAVSGDNTVDPGLEATESASTFYDTFAKDPVANYVPSGARRNVGTGVAVQEPGAEEARGLLPGSITPMTGIEMQRALSSYAPESFGARLATGYEQLFGRPIDVEGAEYFMNRFRNQNLDQAAVNRMLLGGAQGADLAAAQDYQLSLTGGRPDYEARMAQGLSPQYFQPVYRSSYQDYAPTTQAQPRSVFSAGFNPFDYTSAPSAQRLGEIRSALAPYLTAAPAAGPTAGFDAYTGYNPFTRGAVNPYATRMAPPTVQPTSPVPEQPSFPPPTARESLTNPFSRSVGEGVAVNVGPTAMNVGPGAMNAPAPTSFPYLSSYLRAYAKGGGVGSE